MSEIFLSKCSGKNSFAGSMLRSFLPRSERSAYLGYPCGEGEGVSLLITQAKDKGSEGASRRYDRSAGLGHRQESVEEAWTADCGLRSFRQIQMNVYPHQIVCRLSFPHRGLPR